MLDGRFGGDLPLLAGTGYRTPFGILLPPGGKVAAYVHHSSAQRDSSVRNNLVNTLSQGLARAEAGFGDTVVVLPGHSENVTDNTMFATAPATGGVKIIGSGDGAAMPTFRWTATGSSWLWAVPGIQISGLRLRMEGANGITNALNVSAADCSIDNCDIEVASGATAKAAIVCTVAAGADRFTVRANRMRGTETHNVTNGFLVSGAVREFSFEGNRCMFSATAANGLINFTAAALGVYVGKNLLYNSHTSSTSALTCGAVAADGVIEQNSVGVINTGAITALTHGFNINAACLFLFFDNLVVNDRRVNAIANPTADT